MRLRNVIGEPPDRIVDMAYADAERLLRAGQAVPADDGAILPPDLAARFAVPEVSLLAPVAEVSRPRWGRKRR